MEIIPTHDHELFRVYIANTYFYYSLLTVLQVDVRKHQLQATYKIEFLSRRA